MLLLLYLKSGDNHTIQVVIVVRNTTQRSVIVITDHRLLDHEFCWDNVEILYEEPVLRKRLISEMIFIKLQINSLNQQSDTENIDHICIYVYTCNRENSEIINHTP